MSRFFLVIPLILLYLGCHNNAGPEELRLKETLAKEQAMLDDFALDLEKAQTSVQLAEAIFNFCSELRLFYLELSALEDSLPEDFKRPLPPSSLRPAWDSLKLAKARIQKALTDKRHLFNSQVQQALAELETLNLSSAF